MQKKVLSVGQCIPDHMSIRLLLQKAGAEAIPLDFEKEIEPAIASHRPALILLNRIFDRDGTSGLEVIERLQKLADLPPLMLVSNYVDAQEKAIELGALPGFGKSEVLQPAALEKVQRALG